jgi:hypothetical protein
MAALDAGSVIGFLCSADNLAGLTLVFRNAHELMRRGLYETALLSAFTATRTNHHQFPLWLLKWLFNVADKERLRAAGECLPGPGPLRLYRGVAGSGRARMLRGLSWTASRERAEMFARRYPHLPNSAVYRITVSADDVLAYYNGRDEDEFIVLLSPSSRPRRVAPPFKFPPPDRCLTSPAAQAQKNDVP